MQCCLQHSARRGEVSIYPSLQAQLAKLRECEDQPLLPSSAEEGWLRESKDIAKLLYSAQTGWCWPGDRFDFLISTTPSAPSEVAFATFLECRGHPSSAEEGKAITTPGSPALSFFHANRAAQSLMRSASHSGRLGFSTCVRGEGMRPKRWRKTAAE